MGWIVGGCLGGAGWKSSVEQKVRRGPAGLEASDLVSPGMYGASGGGRGDGEV